MGSEPRPHGEWIARLLDPSGDDAEGDDLQPSLLLVGTRRGTKTSLMEAIGAAFIAERVEEQEKKLLTGSPPEKASPTP
jgi:hypothetical protein